MTYEEFALATAVSSTDTDVATVAISDDTVGKIVVTAVAPTTATINVTVTIDGETTALTASVKVEPRSGIYIDDETPIAKYKGTYSALYIKGLPDGMTQAEFASAVTLTCSDENVTATTGENYALGLVSVNIGAGAGSSFTLTVDLDGDVLVIPYTTSVHANAVTAEHGSTPIDPTSPITTAVNDTFRIYLDGLDGTETGARISGVSGTATVSLVATQDGEGYLEVSTPTAASDGNRVPIIIDSPRGSYTVVLLNETIMQVAKESASINVIGRYYGLAAGSGATVTSSTATYGSIKALSSIQSPLTASVVDSSQVDCTSKFTIIADPSVSTGGFSIAQKTGADAPTAGEYTLTLTAGVGQTVQFAVSVPSEPTGPTFTLNEVDTDILVPGIQTLDTAYVELTNIVNNSGGSNIYQLTSSNNKNRLNKLMLSDGTVIGTTPITVDATNPPKLYITTYESVVQSTNDITLTDSNGYSTTVSLNIKVMAPGTFSIAAFSQGNLDTNATGRLNPYIPAVTLAGYPRRKVYIGVETGQVYTIGNGGRIGAFTLNGESWNYDASTDTSEYVAVTDGTNSFVGYPYQTPQGSAPSPCTSATIRFRGYVESTFSNGVVKRFTPTSNLGSFNFTFDPNHTPE